jgi:hypothetical protein
MRKYGGMSRMLNAHAYLVHSKGSSIASYDRADKSNK